RGLVRITPVRGAERLKTAEYARGIRRRLLQVLICGHHEEAAVSCACRGVGDCVVSAIGSAERLDARKDAGQIEWRSRAADVSPAANEAAKMDQIEPIAMSESPQIIRDGLDGWRQFQCAECFQAERRVVQIAVTRSIFEAAVLVQLRVKEL